MNALRSMLRYPLCLVGMHSAPPPRYPIGPMVAPCECCGKVCYFYGLSLDGLGHPPTLPTVPIRAIPRPQYGILTH